MRVDFNVPFDSRGRIKDDMRIRASLDTIRFILHKGGSLMILTHRDEPTHRSRDFSIAPIASRLQSLLGRRVRLVNDVVGDEPGDFAGERVLISENIRFWPGEQANTAVFARALARWGTWYVNDAFAVSHRTSASLIRLPKLIPAYAGFCLEREMRALAGLTRRARRPFFVIVGGAKIATKMPHLDALLQKSDGVFLGGALFNTLLAAEGKEVGKSLIERHSLPQARRLLGKAKLLTPTDVVVVPSLRASAKASVRDRYAVRRNEYIGDIGPKARAQVSSLVARAKTVLWNGPLGYVEIPSCQKGTLAVARALARSRAKLILGGGDLTGMIDGIAMPRGRTHLSTGGGALLSFIAHGTLPGIEALK